MTVMGTTSIATELGVGSIVTSGTGKVLWRVEKVIHVIPDGPSRGIKIVRRIAVASGKRRVFHDDDLYWPSDVPGKLGPRVADFSELTNLALDEMAEQFRALSATEAMLEQLGIRLSRDAGAELACKVLCERGRGQTNWFIQLNSELDVADELKYLKRAWELLLPANDACWFTDEWHADREDPAMEHSAYGWELPASSETA